MTRAGVLALTAGVILSLSGPALAAPADVANSVASEVMSPFCPGSTLHDCSSAEAQALRDRILARAEDGWTRTRLMSWLEDEYGPSIRSTPPTEGAGLLAWLIPIAVVLAGGAVASIFLRRSTRTAGGSEGAEVSGAERSDLERELQALRGRP
jgi:cytochrome c-type biogenesis protein CcmH/NrfF